MQRPRGFFRLIDAIWTSGWVAKLGLGCGALAVVMLCSVTTVGLILAIPTPDETSEQPTNPPPEPTATRPPTSTPQPTESPVPPTATSTPEPTPTPGPEPAISGKLDPWAEDTPIDGRHLALCRVSDTEGRSSCQLMTSSVTTADGGAFEFFDVPPGTYMLIYDSGVSSFDDGMDEWGGTELRIGDEDWRDTYFEDYVGSGWVAVHIPHGADVEPDMIKPYAEFSLGFGDSPFILAHHLGVTYEDEPLVLRHITVDVVEGETAEPTVPIAYYGD